MISCMFTSKVLWAKRNGQKRSGDPIWDTPVEINARYERKWMDSRGVEGNQQRMLSNQRTSLVVMWVSERMNLQDRVWLNYSSVGDQEDISSEGFAVQNVEEMKDPFGCITFFEITLS